MLTWKTATSEVMFYITSTNNVITIELGALASTNAF